MNRQTTRRLLPLHQLLLDCSGSLGVSVIEPGIYGLVKVAHGGAFCRQTVGQTVQRIAARISFVSRFFMVSMIVVGRLQRAGKDAGGGEILGTRQSGTPGFRIARPEEHADLMEVARDDARLILETDPDLKGPRGDALRCLLYLFSRDEAIRLLRAG